MVQLTKVPAHVPGKAVVDDPSTGALVTHRASSWSSPGCCSLLGSESAGGRSVFDSPLSAFQVN